MSSSLESSIEVKEATEVHQEVPDTEDGTKRILTGLLDNVDRPLRVSSQRRQDTIRQSIRALKKPFKPYKRTFDEIDTEIAGDQERRFSIASGEFAFGALNNNEIGADGKHQDNDHLPVYHHHIEKNPTVITVEDIDRPLRFAVNMKSNGNPIVSQPPCISQPNLDTFMQALTSNINNAHAKLKSTHNSNPEPTEQQPIVINEPEPHNSSDLQLSNSPHGSMESINLTHRQENRSLTQETHFASSSNNSDQEIPQLQEADDTVIEIEDKSGETSKLIQS